MKQATQLPIPFDLDDRQADIAPSAVHGADKVHFLSFDAAELRALAAVRRAVKAALPSLVLFAQATLCVCFCFGIMFLAALIGG